jgi:hypothetical protein
MLTDLGKTDQALAVLNPLKNAQGDLSGVPALAPFPAGQTQAEPPRLLTGVEE